MKSLFLYKIEENQLISPANYSSHAGNVERVQPYASVDTRKHLEPGVAGERYKPDCTMNQFVVRLMGDFSRITSNPKKMARSK